MAACYRRNQESFAREPGAANEQAAWMWKQRAEAAEAIADVMEVEAGRMQNEFDLHHFSLRKALRGSDPTGACVNVLDGLRAIALGEQDEEQKGGSEGVSGTSSGGDSGTESFGGWWSGNGPAGPVP